MTFGFWESMGLLWSVGIIVTIWIGAWRNAKPK